MGKRKELLTEFLSFFIGNQFPLPMWHPDGVRRLFKTVSRLGIAFLGALFEFELTETKCDTR